MAGIMSGRMLVAATLTVTVGLLPACSDDDEPPPPAKKTTGPTVTATPSATVSPIVPPTLPASATADPKGAEVFVRYFWDVFNYTYATGDTKLLRSISDSACKFCGSVANDVDSLSRRGARTEGALVTLHEVVAPPANPHQGFPVSSLVSQQAGKVVAADGTVEGQSPAQRRQRSDVRVRWVKDGWRMVGVSFGGPKGST